MYTKNKYVVYGMEGICQIIDIRNEKIGGQVKEYYILKPVYTEGSTIFVPTDNENLLKRMRHVLSVDEIHSLINSMPHIDIPVIEDSKERYEKFQSVLQKGDVKELVMLIKALYLVNEERINEGKKPYKSDEKIIALAEKLVCQEFALVLDIEPEDVVPFITGKLEGK